MGRGVRGADWFPAPEIIKYPHYNIDWPDKTDGFKLREDCTKGRVVAKSLLKPLLYIHNQSMPHLTGQHGDLVLGRITLPKPLIQQKRAPVTSQKGWRFEIKKKKIMDRRNV